MGRDGCLRARQQCRLFRYFENARIEYLRRIGFADNREIGPILASTHCRFRRALTYPDQLHVGIRSADVGEDRFTIEYRIFSEALSDVAADGGGVIVSYDYEKGQKAALPAEVRRAIEELARPA